MCLGSQKQLWCRSSKKAWEEEQCEVGRAGDGSLKLLTLSSSDSVFCVSQCANIGPADYNYDETISTLRYANRAKNIKNKARINEDPKDALLRQFQKEIEELKKKLEEGEIPLPQSVSLYANAASV